MKFWLTLLLAVFSLPWLPAMALAAPSIQGLECVQEATVQYDDWLSKLADKYYGDALAFPAIVAATNQKNEEDSSFTRIDNPHVIEPGWKLCIVSPEQAGLLLEDQLAGSAGQQASFPLTLTDGLGRQVTIEAPAQRIVSLLPSNTEVLFALGLGDRVVGVTEFDNYPPEAQTKQIIGGMTTNTISLETILALEPDLVLAHDDLQQSVIDTLAENGLTVFATNTKQLTDIYRTINWVGQMAGVQDRAEALTGQIQRDITAITARIDEVPADERPAVFYEVWVDPLLTAGPGTYIGQMITLAGAKNIFDDVSQEFPEISAEEVVARNPAVILSAEHNSDNLTDEALAARPGWSEIEAVKNGRVYLLNDDVISRPGPRVALALRTMVEVLYPGLLAEEPVQ